MIDSLRAAREVSPRQRAEAALEAEADRKHGELFAGECEECRDLIASANQIAIDVAPVLARLVLDLGDTLERLVASLETNSEAGAPDYAHAALRHLYGRAADAMAAPAGCEWVEVDGETLPLTHAEAKEWRS